MDISRVDFNAKVDESGPVYVELPPEGSAMLKRHMYGTRWAADGWQSECSGSLIDMGFTQGTTLYIRVGLNT